MNKKKLVQIITQVASKVVDRKMKEMRKQILRDVSQMVQQSGGQQSHSGPVNNALQERGARENSRQIVRQGFQQQNGQQQQQQNGWGNAQPAGNTQGNDPRSAFKQIQERAFQSGNAASPSGGGNMSENEMIQYAESIDPATDLGKEGTLAGRNESKQEFLQNLNRATRGKNPRKIFESSEKNSSKNWRPGMNDNS